MDVFRIEGNSHTYLIYRFVYPPVRSNMYVIFTKRQAIVIDPHISDELVCLLQKNNVQQIHILLTHEHFDHTSGLKWIMGMVQSSLYCHKACAEAISIEKKNNPALVAFVLADKDKLDGGARYPEFKKSFEPYACIADIIFDTATVWLIGEISIKAVSTPGHSLGSCFYYIDDNIVFSGDTILEKFDIITRFRSSDVILFKEKTLPYINSLSPDMLILPGHGEPFKLKQIKTNIYNV